MVVVEEGMLKKKKRLKRGKRRGRGATHARGGVNFSFSSLLFSSTHN